MDEIAYQFIIDLRASANSLNEAAFNELYKEFSFTTILTSGKEVELIKKGKETSITYNKLEEYIKLLVSARINEGSS